MPRFEVGGLAVASAALVRAVLGDAGWEETRGPDWDLRWSGRVPRAPDYREAGDRFFNHRPGAFVLWIKSHLHTTLAGAPFEPRTFVLPAEAEAWREEARRGEVRWIFKPTSSSRGRGVRVLEGTEAGSDNGVVQALVPPLLLHGHKHTLRVYLLVASFSPLRAWLFEDGVIRCAAEPYDAARITDRRVQLTNLAAGGGPSHLRDLRVRDVYGDDVWRGVRAIADGTLAAALGPATVHERLSPGVQLSGVSRKIHRHPVRLTPDG